MTPEDYRKKREEYFAKEQAADPVAEEVEAYESRMNNGVEEIMHEGQWVKCYDLPQTHSAYSPF